MGVYMAIWLLLWRLIIAPTLADVCTALLTILGIVVALYPPERESKKTKYLFVGLFVLFAFLIVGANIHQRSTDSERQDNDKREMQEAEKRFSEDLRSIQNTNDAILKYVANPPKGVTIEQLSTFAKSILASRPSEEGKAQPAPPTASPMPTPTQASIPVISSAPAMYQDGQITGKNFGSKTGQVYLHLRVKPSAQKGDYGDGGSVGPDALLGGLWPSNNIDLTQAGIFQNWTDTSIQLKFPKGYWQQLVERVNNEAQYRKLNPPSQNDLEVGYQLKTSETETTSNQFYPK